MKITNLNVKYKDNQVYKDFSLELPNKGITCVLGPSGCGKTTLLNAICNNVKYSGEIIKVGKTAYVFQSPRLIESISIRKNLEFVMPIINEDKIVNILKELKILDCIDKMPLEISGGQASRVSIARALIYDANVILLDEPFKDLDIILKHDVISIFKHIIEEKEMASIYVTHDVDEALSVANKILVLSDKPVSIKLNLDIDNKDAIRDLSCLELNNARQKIYEALIK